MTLSLAMFVFAVMVPKDGGLFASVNVRVCTPVVLLFPALSVKLTCHATTSPTVAGKVLDTDISLGVDVKDTASSQNQLPVPLNPNWYCPLASKAVSSVKVAIKRHEAPATVVEASCLFI